MAAFVLPSSLLGNTILRMQTDLGGINIELFDVATPQTVENFMNYVNDGDFEGTFIQSQPVFVTYEMRYQIYQLIPNSFRPEQVSTESFYYKHVLLKRNVERCM